ncbi:MAG: acyl-CoA thioesterase [Myxococcota bacterium]
MSDSRFYTPVATHNPRRFLLPVANDLLVGPAERQFMMGGVGLGSAIHALETATGRPLIWATAQYLSFAPPGATVDIDVHIPVTGKTVTQARVVSHVGEREILTVNAALGSRPDQAGRQHVPMPEVPPPDACPVHEPHFVAEDDLHTRLERRDVVDTTTDHDGHARVWIRTLEDEPITAGLLAIFADFLPGSIPVTRGSSSLDNTLRICRLVPARWCLIDSRVQGMASGFFHGELSLFAEDGTLLATASQSGALPKRR